MWRAGGAHTVPLTLIQVGHLGRRGLRLLHPHGAVPQDARCLLLDDGLLRRGGTAELLTDRGQLLVSILDLGLQGLHVLLHTSLVSIHINLHAQKKSKKWGGGKEKKRERTQSEVQGPSFSVEEGMGWVHSPSQGLPLGLQA